MHVLVRNLDYPNSQLSKHFAWSEIVRLIKVKLQHYDFATILYPFSHCILLCLFVKFFPYIRGGKSSPCPFPKWTPECLQFFLKGNIQLLCQHIYYTNMNTHKLSIHHLSFPTYNLSFLITSSPIMPSHTMNLDSPKKVETSFCTTKILTVYIVVTSRRR